MTNECRDCKFYQPREFNGYSYHHCSQETVSMDFFDVVDGWWTDEVEIHRARNHFCKGELFERKLSLCEKLKNLFLDKVNQRV